jgi:hypothetical protein
VFNMDGKAVVTYAKLDPLTTMLGNAIGQRLVASVWNWQRIPGRSPHHPEPAVRFRPKLVIRAE